MTKTTRRERRLVPDITLTEDEAEDLANQIADMPYHPDLDEPVERIDRKLRNLEQFDRDLKRAGKDDAFARRMYAKTKRELLEQREQALRRN